MAMLRFCLAFLPLLWVACAGDATTAGAGGGAPRASARSNAALIEAAFRGDAAGVEALLAEADIDGVDEAGRTALMMAAYDGHAGTVRLLCEKKADPNMRDMNRRTALMYAASGPNAAAVEILLAHGAEVNVTDGDEGWTALMFAAAEGQAEVVSLLLDRGASPDIQDIDGETALTFASQKGHAAVVRLLESGPGG